MLTSYPEIFLAVCILILPFLYESSHAFRYYLKFLVYYGYVMLMAVVLIPVFCFRPGNVKNLLLASTTCRHISTIIGMQWIVKGEEYLGADQACVIVANHQSSIDILAVCILILPFLYEFSHAFRYYLKFLVYYGYVMLMAVVLIPVFCFRPGNVKNLLLASTTCRHISTIIGMQWIVKGEEYLGADQACVIVANHQSSIDILGMLDFWHIMDKCTVIAKRGLMYAGPFGVAAWLCGLIFIPRVKGSTQTEARAIMNKAAEEIKAKRIKLWVFPEGTRRNDGIIHPFKKGAFHLAITAQLPILPVVFSQYYFLDKANKRFDQGKVLVTALPPISTEGMTLDDLDKLMEQTRDVMTAAFQKANKEVRESLRT